MSAEKIRARYLHGDAVCVFQAGRGWAAATVTSQSDEENANVWPHVSVALEATGEAIPILIYLVRPLSKMEGVWS